MAVFGFSVTETIFFSPPRCYNDTKEVIIMMELEDSRQELKYISEDLRAIRTAALMADEAREWDTEGDVVRLIALAIEPIIKSLDDVMVKIDRVIRSKKEEA